jgi:predicted glycosyltransferase
MKIIFYCQHVLGIGHLFRAREICKALVGHEVILVTGGPQIETKLPKHVSVVKLPGLQMDREFKDLFSSDKSASLDGSNQKKAAKKTARRYPKGKAGHFFSGTLSIRPPGLSV